MSRPSLFTQRVYGVSFSVANLPAISSDTIVFLLIACSGDPRQSPLVRQPSRDCRFVRTMAVVMVAVVMVVVVVVVVVVRDGGDARGRDEDGTASRDRSGAAGPR